MSISDMLWVFIILSMLQPVIARKMLDLRRMQMIDRFQKKRGSRVILMVHRQETMRFLGFPLMRYIDIQDSEDVLRAIRMTDKDMPLDIVLHTPGGLVLAALQIARAVEAHRGKVTVFVPHHAMSGGTLVALAADEIAMCDHSVLGPIDPQIGQFPAASILKAVSAKPVAEVDDETLILADVGQKALDQVRRAATEILSAQMPEEKAAGIAELLSSGTWTHDYPISAREAQEIGLNVVTEMPEDVLTMMMLYPQPLRQSGGVEFLPGPQRPTPRPTRR
ncbi:SDH family Clp fold serine proteinase [Albidovulum sediminicola]|uniref:ATP-dependent Clp protease proteolytic subunit n=1 Tax=Albidovulum sediminicola TaxID=2984331 RepID=A0ABT2YW95_9RHOB|nr:ATP-dependent Clp protease proteolytic subunit [Defluviimonas sp. WL0075]MCV2863142.1 ATP-dependent Clp protease proteolytic subunit [Defluviimonas sp. WL0075]